MRIERGRGLLADYAEREHFRAAKGWSIENFQHPSKLTGIKKDTQEQDVGK
ncbi:MAG: hypothetical protein IJZ09_01580 [Tidjanibacter sp.]|nr:hypothetical protein [Tidjanibacter sp.]